MLYGDYFYENEERLNGREEQWNPIGLTVSITGLLTPSYGMVSSSVNAASRKTE